MAGTEHAEAWSGDDEHANKADDNGEPTPPAGPRTEQWA
jgi:hypothetical protein